MYSGQLSGTNGDIGGPARMNRTVTTAVDTPPSVLLVGVAEQRPFQPLQRHVPRTMIKLSSNQKMGIDPPFLPATGIENLPNTLKHTSIG